MAVRMPMMATTIINSMSVKPRWLRILLCQKLNMSISSSCWLGYFGPPPRPQSASGSSRLQEQCQASRTLLARLTAVRNSRIHGRSDSDHIDQTDNDGAAIWRQSARWAVWLTALVSQRVEKCHGSTETDRRARLCFWSL